MPAHRYGRSPRSALPSYRRPEAKPRLNSGVSTATMKYFEDVEEGTALPPLTKEITTVQMMMYGAATWDFIRVHYDADYTRQMGFPGPFVDGQMLGAFLAQLVVDWVEDPGALKRLSVRYHSFVFPGDTVTCKGSVRRKHVHGQDTLVECELTAENQKGEIVAGPGVALLALPIRGP